jgi:hypothetical protein
MSFIRSAALVLLLTVTFIACKKDSAPKSAGIFEGTWKGNFGFDNDEPNIFTGYVIKSGGVIQEISSTGKVKGEGKWDIQGNTLKGNYKMVFSPFSEYSVSIQVDQVTGLMTGTWGFDKSETTGGKLKLNKVN